MKAEVSEYSFRANSPKKRRLSELQNTCKFFPNCASRKVAEVKEIFFCSKFPLWRSDSGLSQLVSS